MADPIQLTGAFKDVYGTKWAVNIHNANHASTSYEVVLGAEGFILNYEGNNEERLQPLIGSTLTFTIVDDGSTEVATFISNMATSEEGELQVSVYQDPDSTNTPYWYGSIVLERVVLEDLVAPTTITIRAVCGIGLLQSIKYNNDGPAYTGEASAVEHILNCLNKVHHIGQWGSTENFIYFAEDFYSVDGVGSYTQQLPNTRIEHNSFYNKDSRGVKQYFSAADVLSSFCITFNARLFQANGAYHFIPVGVYDYSQTNYSRYWYYKDGTTPVTNAGTLDPKVEVSGKDTGGTFNVGDVIRLDGWQLSHLAPLKEVRRTRNYQGNLGAVSNPTYSKQDITSATLLTDEDRTYSANTQFRISGMLYYHWDGDGTSGDLADDDRVVRLEVRISFKVGSRYYHRPTYYNQYSTSTANFYDSVQDQTPVQPEYWDVFLDEESLDTTSTNRVMYVTEVFDARLGTSLHGPLYFPFSYTTTGLPAEAVGIDTFIEVVGRGFYGNNRADILTTADYNVSQFRIDVLEDGQESAGDTVDISASAVVTGTGAVYNQGNVLIGDQVSSLGLGTIFVNDGTDYIPSTGWKSINYTTAAQSIHRLGVMDALAAQKYALKTQYGNLLQDSTNSPVFMYTLLKDLRNGTHYLPTQVQHIAASCTYKVEVFKIGQRDYTSITVAQDNKKDINPPNNGGGAGGVTPPPIGFSGNWGTIIATGGDISVLQTNQNKLIGLVDIINGTVSVKDTSSSNTVTLEAPALTSGYSLSLPPADGTNGQVLATDGAGALGFITPSGGGGLADVVDDTTPQLGGDLDVNGNKIVTTSAGNVEIQPDTSGYTRIANPNGYTTQIKLGGNTNSGGSASIDWKHHTTATNVGARIVSTGTAYGSSTGLKFYVKGRNTADGAALTDSENLIMTLSHLDGCVIHKQFTAVGGDLTFGYLNGVTTSSKRIGVRGDEPNPTQSSLYIDAGLATYQNRAGGTLYFRAGPGAGTGDSGSIIFYTCEGIQTSGTTNTNLERMRLLPNGYLGIGTAAPTEKLEVAGNIKAVDIQVTGNLTGVELNDLDNVDTTGVSDGDGLVYDSATSTWVVNTSAGGNHAFHQIAVSGQSTVEADSANDILTLVAGTNLAITTNATTDTITFTPSLTPSLTSVTVGSGGVVSVGAISTLGNLSASGSLSAGSASFSGNATFNGSLTAGATIVSSLQFTGGGTSSIGIATGLPNQPSDLELLSNGNVTVVLDYDSNEAAQAFIVKNQAGTVIFQVDEDGVTSGLLTTATPTITGLPSSAQQGSTVSAASISNYDAAATYVAKVYNSSGVEQTSSPVTIDSSGNISFTAPSTIATGYELRVYSAAAGKLRSAEAVGTFQVTASRTFTHWRMQGCDSSGTASALKLGVIEMNYWTSTGGTGTKYPTSAATSNTSISGVTISAGHQYSSGYAAWKAFDRSGANDGYNDNSGSMWWTLANSVAANNWNQLEFSTAQTFQSVTIHVYRSFSDATHVKILGSNTGAFSGEEIECAIIALDGSATGAGQTYTGNL